MLIDKFRGLIRSDFDRKKILMYSLPIVSFIIGLLVPSPLFVPYATAFGPVASG